MNQEVLDTKNFFRSYHVPFSDLWLESCISWFREQQQAGRNYSSKELRTAVYDQWLLLDLRDVEVPQLKPNELKEKKIVINRTLSLQLLSVIDISKPKLLQLQNMRKLHMLTANIEEGESNYENNTNVNGKRVLQLTLTDGINEIKALEYKTIPVLNLSLKPGTKIRINPPVVIRRGQLMLEQHNVKLLGGEVEDILVSHSVENILARALNLPEKTDPEQGQGSYNLITGTDNKSMVNITRPEQQHSHDIQTWNVNNVKSEISAEEWRIEVQTWNVNNVKSEISAEEQEELRIAAEIDMLMEVENELSHSVPKIQSETPDMFAEHDEEIFNKKQIKEDTSEYPESVNSRQDEEDIFCSIDIDQHLDQIEEQMCKMSQQKIYKIADLIQKKENGIKGKYQVHARFKSVTQKLTLAETWILQILISDDSGELQVFVHNDIVTKFIGYPVTAIIALKKDVEAKDSNAIQTVMKALDGLKDKLLKLDCLMEIEIESANEVPVITALFKFPKKRPERRQIQTRPVMVRPDFDYLKPREVREEPLSLVSGSGNRGSRHF